MTTATQPTRRLLDLVPNASPSRWELLERAFELIEEQRGWFSLGDIHKALGRYPAAWSAARQAAYELESYGLLDRKGVTSYTRFRVRSQGGNR
jgi:hypothetical protein